MAIVVWKSSATVSVSTPPTCSSAVRRTQRGGTAPEHRVVPILARRDDFVEETLLVPGRLRVLGRIAVVEVVRRLHERDVRRGEVADGGVEDVGRGHVVGVEEQDHFTVRGTPSAWLMLPALA